MLTTEEGAAFRVHSFPCGVHWYTNRQNGVRVTPLSGYFAYVEIDPPFKLRWIKKLMTETLVL